MNISIASISNSDRLCRTRTPFLVFGRLEEHRAKIRISLQNFQEKMKRWTQSARPFTHETTRRTICGQRRACGNSSFRASSHDSQAFLRRKRDSGRAQMHLPRDRHNFETKHLQHLAEATLAEHPPRIIATGVVGIHPSIRDERGDRGLVFGRLLGDMTASLLKRVVCARAKNGSRNAAGPCRGTPRQTGQFPNRQRDKIAVAPDFTERKMQQRLFWRDLRNPRGLTSHQLFGTIVAFGHENKGNTESKNGLDVRIGDRTRIAPRLSHAEFGSKLPPLVALPIFWNSGPFAFQFWILSVSENHCALSGCWVAIGSQSLISPKI